MFFLFIFPSEIELDSANLLFINKCPPVSSANVIVPPGDSLSLLTSSLLKPLWAPSELCLNCTTSWVTLIELYTHEHQNKVSSNNIHFFFMLKPLLVTLVKQKYHPNAAQICSHLQWTSVHLWGFKTSIEQLISGKLHLGSLLLTFVMQSGSQMTLQGIMNLYPV